MALILVVSAIVVTAIDSRIFEVTQQISVERPGAFSIFLYTTFVGVFILCNVFFLNFVNDPSLNSRYRIVRYLYRGVWINQSIIASILVLILAQMILFGGYSNVLLILVIYLSQISTVVLLGFLVLRLIGWLKSSPNYAITVYAIGFGLIMILTTISTPYLTHRLQDKTEMVEPRPYRIVKLAEAIPSPVVEYAHLLSYYIFTALVLTTCIVTVSLLRPYSNKIGNVRYWIVISIPLVYLIFQSIITARIGWDAGAEIIQLMETVFFFQVTNQVAGVFFGVTFWITSRRIKGERLKNSLVVVAVGIILIFSSVEVGLILLPAYPPFGLTTLAFSGLASFLLMLGIVDSASIIAKDGELRRELFKNLSRDSKMLTSLGQAESREEIERTVKEIVDRSESLRNNQPTRYELEPDEVEQVINDVLTELGKK